MSTRRLLLWRSIGLFGVLLITLGTAYFFFDEVTTDWYGSRLLDIFGIVGMIGVPVAFIGLIGWAKQVGKQKRLKMAASIFFAPLIAVFCGYHIDDLNIHGSFGLVFGLAFLAVILTIILLIMAAATEK